MGGVSEMPLGTPAPASPTPAPVAGGGMARSLLPASCDVAAAGKAGALAAEAASAAAAVGGELLAGAQEEQFIPPLATTDAGTRYTWPEKRAATTPPQGRGCTCRTDAEPSGTGASQQSAHGKCPLFPSPAQVAQHGFASLSVLASPASSESRNGSHSVRREPLLRPNTGRSPTRVTELTGSQLESVVGKIARPRRMAASTARRRHSGHTGTEVAGMGESLLVLEPRGRLHASCDRREGVLACPTEPAPPSARGLPPHMAGHTGLHFADTGSSIEHVQASAAMSRARKKGERRTAVVLNWSAADTDAEPPAECACGGAPAGLIPGDFTRIRPVAISRGRSGAEREWLWPRVHLPPCSDCPTNGCFDISRPRPEQQALLGLGRGLSKRSRPRFSHEFPTARQLAPPRLTQRATSRAKSSCRAAYQRGMLKQHSEGEQMAAQGPHGGLPPIHQFGWVRSSVSRWMGGEELWRVAEREPKLSGERSHRRADEPVARGFHTSSRACPRTQAPSCQAGRRMEPMVSRL